MDACSGLKMLMTFAAFAVGAVLLIDRTRFEKLMVLLGIVPIAVVTNVLRITATGRGAHDHPRQGHAGLPARPARLADDAGRAGPARAATVVLSRLVVRPTAPEVGFAPVRPAFARTCERDSLLRIPVPRTPLA